MTPLGIESATFRLVAHCLNQIRHHVPHEYIIIIIIIITFIALAGATQWITYNYMYPKNIFFFLWRCSPTRIMTSSVFRFLDHTQRRTAVDRTPLEEWSARHTDLYLTTHNLHNRKTSMPPVGFEPTISAGERPQTYALDRAATGTSTWITLTFRRLTSTIVHVPHR